MTTTAYEPIYFEKPCRCRAHALHRLYRAKWESPGTSLKILAQGLRLNYNSAKVYAKRLRELSDITRRCPLCFEPQFYGLVCRSCGFEADQEDHPTGVSVSTQSPVYVVQPNGGLGSRTHYPGLKLAYGSDNVRHLAEKPTDSRFEAMRSRLWEALKAQMPRDDVTEDAVRLLKVEYSRLYTDYPVLFRSRNLSTQILERVWARLRLLYPNLAKEFPQVGNGYRVTRKVGLPDDFLEANGHE